MKYKTLLDVARAVARGEIPCSAWLGGMVKRDNGALHIHPANVKIIEDMVDDALASRLGNKATDAAVFVRVLSVMDDSENEFVGKANQYL